MSLDNGMGRSPILQWKRIDAENECESSINNNQPSVGEFQRHQESAELRNGAEEKKPIIIWKRVEDDTPVGQQGKASGASAEQPGMVVHALDDSTNREKPKAKFGTREISDISANIQVGCSNDCKYCYAAHRAVAGGYVKDRCAWGKDFLKQSQPSFNKRFDGVVMYPTTHDITRRFLRSHCQAILEILEAGNDLLICSKARLDCMQKVAESCAGYEDKVTFMITITTLDEAQSVFWEPNAPLPCERIAALKFLHDKGFRTSIIIEPLLQGPCSAQAIYHAASPFVSEAIWIGTMNMIDDRVDLSNPDNARAVEAIRRYHSIDNLRFLYNTMKDLPKVKFKSSITRIFEKNAES